MSKSIEEFLQNKSILILGFGREGKSTYNYIKKHMPDKKIAIADQNKIEPFDDNVMLLTGGDYLNTINLFDVVIKSPGISVRDIEISENTIVTCQLDLFLKYADCKKIGITGTKGKTTTSTLTHLILKASGMDSILIGNMGIAVLDFVDSCKGKVAVIEMSSHQLEFTTSSPEIALITNIYPEHLDHYNGFEGYVGAKSHIVIHQNKENYFICNKDQNVFKYINEDFVISKKIFVGKNDGENDEFLNSISKINPHLRGAHNIQDIYYACTIARLLGVSNESMKKGIESFGGIVHRMEYVGRFEDIEFYNDCIATVPTSVMMAVEALEKVDTLIIGGLDRGLDYSEFINELNNSDINNLICLPTTGHDIGKKIINKNVIMVSDMREAVDNAFKYTKKDSICLISPAAASYNVYKNFEEKGDHFKSLVRNHSL